MTLDSSRRVWLKRFVLGTVASVSLPKWAGILLAEVDEVMPGSATLKLKIADYPNLEPVGGSVQLLFNSLSKPFTLNRTGASEFITLDSVCTHRGCTVGPFILANGCMECPCHGSQYDLEGQVSRGPATINLARFETIYDEDADLVSITIPGLALAVRSIQVFPQAAGSVRVQLRFPATARSTYEVKYQEALDGEFASVPFTTTPDGTTFQDSITPATSGFINVYADATGSRGFYVIGLVLTPI